MGVKVDGVLRSGCAKVDGLIRGMTVDGSPRCDDGVVFTVPSGLVPDGNEARITFHTNGRITTLSDAHPVIANRNWAGSWHQSAPQIGVGANYEIRFKATNIIELSGGDAVSDPDWVPVGIDFWTPWASLSINRFVRLGTDTPENFTENEFNVDVEIRRIGALAATVRSFFLKDG